ncbi:hypothetical protein pb186bvf_016807 [Paramecium bursaria]
MNQKPINIIPIIINIIENPHNLHNQIFLPLIMLRYYLIPNQLILMKFTFGVNKLTNTYLNYQFQAILKIKVLFEKNMFGLDHNIINMITDLNCLIFIISERTHQAQQKSKQTHPCYFLIGKFSLSLILKNINVERVGIINHLTDRKVINCLSLFQFSHDHDWIEYSFIEYKGVIAYPYVTYEVGWLWAIILVLPIIICCMRSTKLLIDVAQDLGSDSYTTLGRLTLGSFWANTIDCFIISIQVGIGLAYIMFLTQGMIYGMSQLSYVLEKWKIYVVCFLVVLPLLLIKNVHFFHSTSKLSLQLAVVAQLLVVLESSYILLQGDFSFKNAINIENTFQYVGVSILVFEVGPTILPIRESMYDKQKFPFVANISFISALLITMFLAIISAVTYQDTLQEIVIFNIKNSYLEGLAIIFYSIALLLVYPLQLYPAIQIIENYFQQNDVEGGIFVTKFGQILIRVICGIIMNLIAYQILSLSHLLNLLGSLFGSALQFIFPILIHYYNFQNKDVKLPWHTYSGCLILAMISIIWGTWNSLIGLV